MPFWRNLRVNLSANDCRSGGKNLDVRSSSLHLPISASSLPTLVSFWQPLGILGNRLVYSTFHHIGSWIIHLSRGPKGGDKEWEREWETQREREGGGGQWENEWIDRIYTSCSVKLIIEIWSASHILWLLQERAQCACFAEISRPPVDHYASAGQSYSEHCAHQWSRDPGKTLDQTSSVSVWHMLAIVGATAAKTSHAQMQWLNE